MLGFRLFLGFLIITVVGYTLIVLVNHGLTLFPVFFGDLLVMEWPGQFNMDFSCFLALSAFWLAWRNDFSAGGFVLAVAGFFGGFPLLGTYLLFLSFKTEGDVAEMLLGAGRKSLIA